MRIDHLVYACRDLDEAARRFWDDLGLGSVEGGRHPGWGTGNRIVPLGPHYVELLAVVDPAEAAGSMFGTWVQATVAGGDHLAAWAVAVDDLDREATRLDLTVVAGSRVHADGSAATWRLAGLERMLADSSLPFFIQWDMPPERHPGLTPVTHRVHPPGVAWVEVSGHEYRFDEWLDGAELPLRIEKGMPALLGAGIGTAEGEVVLR